MPVVPMARQPTPQKDQLPQVEPKFLAMAAAMMHSEGRLFKAPDPELPKESA